ncbi:hypothetical protein GOP47_0020043 [Adiantum capillus-veneris]|uniref:Uncharacterized protein n=1 Tax=Adiantum capillus-veneris TaxID=13818 RepID=A0A9D4Z7M3_ADICA|nr:hypothetical protein GOP47_0020043 [Adiantum capillus-veneris]
MAEQGCRLMFGCENDVFKSLTADQRAEHRDKYSVDYRAKSSTLVKDLRVSYRGKDAESSSTDLCIWRESEGNERWRSPASDIQP